MPHSRQYRNDQNGVHQRSRVFAAFKPVLKTPFLSCDPESREEVHSLTCRSHMYMYLTMIKSLLRFYRDVAVFVHDDGTLTDGDARLLERHVRGIRVIRKKDADRKVNRLLRPYPLCRELRRSFLNSMQVFDLAAFSRSGKVANIDSDILFFRRPARLIDWWRSGRREVLYFYEPRPWRQKEFLARFGCDFPPHFNIGLCCFYTDSIDLDIIEDILRRDDPGKRRTIQNIFLVMARRSTQAYRLLPFDRRTYQGFGASQSGVTMRHYYSSWHFCHSVLRQCCLRDGAAVIRELKRGGR